jgi:hypothetical protein
MTEQFHWRSYLRDAEPDDLEDAERNYEAYKEIVSDQARVIDAIRRKAMQRARNAQNKALRAAMKKDAQ